MLSIQSPRTGDDDDISGDVEFRDIHALTPRRDRSPAPSVVSDLSVGEEYSLAIVADSAMRQNDGNVSMGRIGEEEEEVEEVNPLAIVPDNNPRMPSPRRAAPAAEEVSVVRVKKEEVESKIAAWQTAEIAKVNNRFKRDDVFINGWENEKVEKATAWLKKIERKLDEQRAKAIEKTQNDVAKAHRKAEEKKASAEAKRGTKIAKVLEMANFMRAVGRTPSRRSLF
ncbi:remorin 4.1-like [Typha angustifolia]|uniref:remorin 4.1-like n=1 Tax=Typha angustifolia TaxID=59011 RepID=UPI003C301090